MRFPHDDAGTDPRGLQFGRPTVTVGELAEALAAYLREHPRARFAAGGQSVYATRRVFWTESRSERVGDVLRTVVEDVVAPCAVLAFGADATPLATGATPAEFLMALRRVDAETLLREPIRVCERAVPVEPGVQRVCVDLAADLDRLGLCGARLREQLAAGTVAGLERREVA